MFDVLQAMASVDLTDGSPTSSNSVHEPNGGNMPDREMVEAEAIAMAKRGDTAGYEELYRLHRTRVYSLCLRHTSNSSDSEDLTHDVFMQVLRKINSFRGEAQFGSWLYRVTWNYLLLHSRKQKRKGLFVVESLADDCLNEVRSGWRTPADRLALRQALGSLSPKRRKVVLLHDIKGLTHREVAWRLGVSVTASKSRLHQAHIALREALSHRYTA